MRNSLDFSSQVLVHVYCKLQVGHPLLRKLCYRQVGFVCLFGGV